jgi:hypothetical protein
VTAGDSFTAEMLRGVELALAGDWQAAHGIAQRHEGQDLADWLHAVVHKLEGDLGNSRSWYRRAGSLAWVDAVAADELREIRKRLDASAARGA